MTQHIKAFLILLLFGFSLSCKEKNDSVKQNNSGNYIKVDNDSLTENIDGYAVWYPASDILSQDNKSLRIYISQDSVKVFNHEILICKGEIIKENMSFTTFFKSERIGGEIKEKLLSEYQLGAKDDLLVISNAYGEISSKGCQFPLSEMFIVDNHLFFYDQGYQCFLLTKNDKSLLNNNGDNFLHKYNNPLPYNKTISTDEVTYNKINVKNIGGLEDFSCGEKELRYLPVLTKGKVDLILVPQDCGDFPYRFYLLAIKNNNVISDLYVEGEWFEPESNSYKEITSFIIDESFIINVKTKSVENGRSKLKTEDNYKISESGKFEIIK